MSGQYNPLRRWSLFNQTAAPPQPGQQPAQPYYPQQQQQQYGYPQNSGYVQQGPGPSLPRPQSTFFYAPPVVYNSVQSPVHSQQPSYNTPQYLQNQQYPPPLPPQPHANYRPHPPPGPVLYNPAVAAAAPPGVPMQYSTQTHIRQPPPLPPRPVSFHYQPPPPPPQPQVQLQAQVQAQAQAQVQAQAQPQKKPHQELAESQSTFGVPPPPYDLHNSDAQVTVNIDIARIPTPPPVEMPVTVPEQKPVPESPKVLESDKKPVVTPEPGPSSNRSPQPTADTDSAPEVVPGFDPGGIAAGAPIPVSSEEPLAKDAFVDDKPRMYASFNNYRDDFAYWSQGEQTGVEKSVEGESASAPTLDSVSASAAAPPLKQTPVSSVGSTHTPAPLPARQPAPPRLPSARKPVATSATSTTAASVLSAPPTPAINTNPSPPVSVDTVLTKQFASMKVSDWTDDDIEFQRMPIIAASGPGNAVGFECTSDRYLDYAARFYYMPSTPGFLVCSYCFNKHLIATQLAQHFLSGVVYQGRCLFNTRHITSVLLPAAVASGSHDALVEHMAKRTLMPACAGPDGIGPTNGMSWYMVRNEASTSLAVLESLLVCEACFNDVIDGGPFAASFMPLPDTIKHEDNTTWVCDLSLPYVRRGLLKAMTAGDWRIFTAAVETRVPLATCPGKVPAGSPVRWMTAAPPLTVPGFRACEACVLDAVGGTPFAVHFAPATGPLPGQKPTDPTICALKLNLPANVALSNAVAQRNFNIFLTAARIACGPEPGPCINAGKQSHRWYSPVHGGAAAGEMDVCEACYTGILALLGMGLHFRANTRPQNLEVLCDLTLFGPTGRAYLQLLMQAVDRGTMEPFTRALETKELTPADGGCPGSTPTADRTWFGWSRAFPDTAICPACFAAVAERSPLAQTIDVRQCIVPTTTMCSLYSVRMRSLFARACREGSPDSFLAFAAQRVAVWVRVWEHTEGLKRFEAAKQHQNMLDHAGNVNTIFASMVGEGTAEQWEAVWKAVE
ncbi:hypothetical protein CFIMG_007685RA00001 [Ceratocystis fimbriata CBS 114723]|uniref:Uncharacterized protein n=1 Tax=Ceratocystis fimbriata CBS 114723 TaxID=1035309 RepID=A0A2C5XEF4_9PEZI|nr:hypothetical protein CFIMG_007685RA00001 [Ceratocystis fimbriata CBS 114723]